MLDWTALVNHTSHYCRRRRRGLVLFGAVVLLVDLALLLRNAYNKEEPHQEKPLMIRQSTRIRQISVLGERNSGTRWIYDHLMDCFNNSIYLRRSLSRHKHWFQHENTRFYHHGVLALELFRHPYYWLKAMQDRPHHAPNHLFLNDSEFLTRPWTMDRIGSDLVVSEQVRNGTIKCQQDFNYSDIISCEKYPIPEEQYNHFLFFSEAQPFYEMKPGRGGEPFANIMEMRGAKIRNFLGIKDYEGVVDVWTLQYEYLLKNGTKHLLDRISEATGVEYQCDPFPPQEKRDKREMTKSFVRLVNEHLDWSAEALIGYSPVQV